MTGGEVSFHPGAGIAGSKMGVRGYGKTDKDFRGARNSRIGCQNCLSVMIRLRNLHVLATWVPRSGKEGVEGFAGSVKSNIRRSES